MNKNLWLCVYDILDQESRANKLGARNKIDSVEMIPREVVNGVEFPTVIRLHILYNETIPATRTVAAFLD